MADALGNTCGGKAARSGGFVAAKGGVATAWMLHEMSARGVMPAALVLNTVNPIMVQGVALADFTATFSRVTLYRVAITTFNPMERAVAAEICMMPFGPDGLSALGSPQLSR